MARKSKAQLEQEKLQQQEAMLISSWELKHYGNTIAQDEYVKLYSVPIDKQLDVLHISASVDVPVEFKQYNNGKFRSSITIPVAYDSMNPESEDNLKRIKHAIMIRDHLLEQDLHNVRKTFEEAYEESQK